MYVWIKTHARDCDRLGAGQQVRDRTATLTDMNGIA